MTDRPTKPLLQRHYTPAFERVLQRQQAEAAAQRRAERWRNALMAAFLLASALALLWVLQGPEVFSPFSPPDTTPPAPLASAPVTPVPVPPPPSAADPPAPLPNPLPALLPPARLAQIEQSCRRIEQAAAEDLQDQFAPVFDDIQSRVPGFADWLFGWSPSYERDRKLFWVATNAAWERLQNGEVLALWPGIERDVRVQIADSFHDQVLKPDDTNARLKAAWSSANQNARRAAATVWERERRDSPHFPRPEKVENEAAQPNANEIMAQLGPQIDAVLVRTPRPLIARLTGFLVRLSAGVTTGRIARTMADVTDLGLWGYGPGIVIGLGVAFTTTWSIDYLISRADEWLNRADYEREVTQMLDVAEGVMAGNWSSRLREDIAQRCRPRPVQP